MSGGEIAVQIVQSLVELVKLLLPVFLAWHLPSPSQKGGP